MPTDHRTGLSADRIRAALGALNDELQARDIVAELAVFGGAVMVLAFRARLATKDVDAIFEPKGPVREAARRVAETHGLPADWLNDGVKGFVSPAGRMAEASGLAFSNLRIVMPVPEYLLAMKCMAARVGGVGDQAGDVADIRTLISALGLKRAEDVLAIVTEYYPPERVPIKTRFLVESLFEEGAL